MIERLKSHFCETLKKFPVLCLRRSSSLNMSVEHRFRNHVLEIFDDGVKSVKPQSLVKGTCRRTSSGIMINGHNFPLKQNAYIVGFGKAVLGMARAAEDILGEHLVKGIISVPNGIRKQMLMKNDKNLETDSKVQVLEGAANNLPDDDSLRAAAAIINLVSSLNESDLLLVLISGGGSALLPAPVPPVKLSEKQIVVKMLADHGASIQEINIIRKRLSTVKGGGLARLAKPAQVVSLILSDIIGDPLDLIASGPTIKNVDDPSLGLSILQRLGLRNEVPANVLKVLEMIPENNAEEEMNHVMNILVGTNATAAEAACRKAEQLGYISSILTLSIQGEASLVGSKLAELGSLIYQGRLLEIEPVMKALSVSANAMQSLMSAHTKSLSESKDLCIVLGGETVVKVLGKGVGGRNQEVALSAALELQKEPQAEIVILCAGTDGIDGPTNAAGAIATPTLVAMAEKQGLRASKYLDDNDSFTFFANADCGKWHVVTGHTGTNVMDLIIILINLRK